MTAFMDITTAVIAVLSAEPAVSPNIFRARDRTLAEEHVTAINVQWDDGDPNHGAMHGAPVDWESKLTVECYARSSVTSGDLAVDPLLKEVYARIAADSTLGGLVAFIRCVRIKAENDSQGQKTGWICMTYSVSHRTSNLTLD